MDYTTALYDGDQSVESEASSAGDPARAAPLPAIDLVLTTMLLEAVTKTGQKSLRNADNFAYLLYESGRFDQAEKFAQLSNGTKSLWVRARLAQRAGQDAEAERLYLLVRQSYQSDKPRTNYFADYSDDDVQRQCQYIDGERGIAAFNRGEFERAITLFADECDGSTQCSSAYIAERIMSRKQLRAYVDHAEKHAVNVPLSPVVAMSKRILGLRYLRTGQLDLAETYLEPNSDAYKFIQASRTAALASGIAKAQRLYELAIALRKASYDGEYFLALVLPISVDSYDQNRVFERDASYAKRQPLASEQAPGQRFSARFHIVAIALQATDALPKKSQAFAAVLCQASHWAMPKDPVRGRAIYQRYVREGAFQAWAKDFGTNRCPVPNFALAQHRENVAVLKQKLRAIRQALKTQHEAKL